MSPKPAGPLLDRVAELEAENARLKALVPKWISVSERLPKHASKEHVWFQPAVERGSKSNHLTARILADRFKPVMPRATTHWLEGLPPLPSSTQDGHDNNAQQGEAHDAR
jgi:hypothetical protein